MKIQTQKTQPALVVYLFALTTFLLSSCDNKPASLEDEIRQFIDSSINAAEQRDSSTLLERIRDNYHDKKGHNRQQLSSLVRLYFLRNRSIYLFSKIRDIQITGNQNASVKLYVAMAGKQISDVTLLSNYRASIYRFELRLSKVDGEWMLEQADWARASASDMQ